MDTVSARELDRYANDGRFLVIDLRSRREYLQGHVKGAINIPQGRFRRELEGENRTLILYCDRGALSMAVARQLEQQGYSTKSVVGGYQAYQIGRMNYKD